MQKFSYDLHCLKNRLTFFMHFNQATISCDNNYSIIVSTSIYIQLCFIFTSLHSIQKKLCIPLCTSIRICEKCKCVCLFCYFKCMGWNSMGILAKFCAVFPCNFHILMQPNYLINQTNDVIAERWDIHYTLQITIHIRCRTF